MRTRRPALCLLALPLLSLPAAGRDDAPARIAFNRDVRPILADACYQCHGPDSGKRKAGLRLDTPAGRRAALPGPGGTSDLLRRISSADPAERMPPPKAGRPLTGREVALLREWVRQGADWQGHWAFLPPRRPPVPPVKAAAWPRNPIDAFILARLEREGLTPSPEADMATLIRRLTLDLTGLPPTPEEVDAFLKAVGAEPQAAYAALVDRLLASPGYGERMAVRWLDAARYADTSGYQSDGERVMWRWRDWVIDAYNRNLPFDQFTVEQLAGDLLPGATLEQKLATGFNRNHRGNAEGGVIPAEYAVEYVADRVETTATVWMGLTVGCARCHDHKFDPIAQREFYQLFAFFNNVPEKGRAVKLGNSPPMLPTPTRDQLAEHHKLEEAATQAAREVTRLLPEARPHHQEWLRRVAEMPAFDWAPGRDLVAHFPLDGPDSGWRWLPAGMNPAARQAMPTKDERRGLSPPSGRATAFDGQSYLDGGNVGDFGFLDKFTLACWVYCDQGQGGTLISRMADIPEGDGYSLALEDGYLHVRLTKRWLDDALRVRIERRLEPGRWHHVLASYDGSRLASGVAIAVDGAPQPTQPLLDELNQTFQTPEPLRIGAGGGQQARFTGRLADVRVYRRVLQGAEVAALACPEPVPALAARLGEGGLDHPKLRLCYLADYAPPPLRRAVAAATEARERLAAFVESLPTTMVMEELPSPRPAFVLQRGQYDRPGERVFPGVPHALGPLAAGLPRNRLGLARWLTAPDHPLTARVAVNRLWQMLFGVGFVKTAEDFGLQGEWPSHPELLDWLATEYVRLGWDTKALFRLIVTSATYRQASRVTPALLARDPENRLLARGPRQRLAAEAVRDQALAASGLLVERLGGPSVKPYQPPGLWKELSGADDYVPDTGEGLYRRSLYTFWKRAAPPPSLLTFDAAGRETCTVRETRTNTPLQALNLLNDVTYVEAARVLAQRALREAGADPAARLTRLFRLVVARPPRPAELAVLRAGLDRHLAAYRADPEAAARLVRVGSAPVIGPWSAEELAAYVAVAGLVLNLDEAVTKE